MRCPVCEGANPRPLFAKHGVDYSQCRVCAAVFCAEIPASTLKTENSYPEDRTGTEVQAARLRRIAEALERKPRRLLDVGCGEGAFVAFAQADGIAAIGVDQHTPVKLSDLRGRRFDAITMVEVIEHLEEPIAVFRKLSKLLVHGGVIYGESSFIESFADLFAAAYIDPRIGHRCVFSKQGVAVIAARFGLRLSWINDNVFVLASRRPAWVRLRRWFAARKKKLSA